MKQNRQPRVQRWVLNPELLLGYISGAAQGEDAHIGRLAIDIDNHALAKELKLLKGTDNIIEVATMRTQGNRHWLCDFDH
jgi:hypothetical protein